MITIEQIELKQLNKNGLQTLVSWARTEGWNPGDNDFDVFWKTDPNGFYGFYHLNKLIAGGAIVSYNQDFGFMGLFIVHPEYRGLGIGNKLWHLRKERLIKRLKEGASIGMDGVVAMQSFYEKGGFKIAYKEERYERIGEKFNVNSAISKIEDTDFEKIANYDVNCFGFRRKTFLKSWLSLPNSNSFKFTEKESIKGFAVIRKVHIGHKIGPLFADNYEVAEALYKACLNAAPSEPVYLDIPVINEDANKLIKVYNAKYTFECARMYYGNFPKIATNKVFGITTFELG